MPDEKTRIFEENRKTLEGLAYRMLGSLADAQDLVQDTYLKWLNNDTGNIHNPRAWLIKVCSRLALNNLQSARVKRETYIGVWLPEPFIDEKALDISAQVELDETVSVALLLTLEKLTPAERAVHLLHEVFEYSFEEISNIIGKESANCRQLAGRARKRIREDKPRFQTTPEEQKNFLDLFLKAAREGELEQFKEILAGAVELYSDGGGKVSALDEVLSGANTVGKFFIGIWKQYVLNNITMKISLQWFNGSPGILLIEDGTLTTAITLDINSEGIQHIYAIRNPDKLELFAKQIEEIRPG